MLFIEGHASNENNNMHDCKINLFVWYLNQMYKAEKYSCCLKECFVMYFHCGYVFYGIISICTVDIKNFHTQFE